MEIIKNVNIINGMHSIIRKVVINSNTNRLLDQTTGILLTIAALNNHNSFNDTLLLLDKWTQMKLDKKMSSFDNEKRRSRIRFAFN